VTSPLKSNRLSSFYLSELNRGYKKFLQEDSFDGKAQTFANHSDDGKIAVPGVSPDRSWDGSIYDPGRSVGGGRENSSTGSGFPG
jgi:hypothetical protein